MPSTQSQDLSEPENSLEINAELAFYGFQVTQAVYVATKFGIAEHLKHGSKSEEELAMEIGVDVKPFRQLLRLLAHLDIVTVDDNNHYQLTVTGSHLCADTPDSLLGSILSLAEIYQAWGNLSYSIQTGKAAFDKTFHKSLYEYLDQNPQANTHFNLWMKETTREWLIPALEAYDFSPFKTFVDVGGSTGTLTAEILKKYPNLQAILFDQERAIGQAEATLTVTDVADRCQIISGNFFESVPTCGELYLISRVLINWDDTHALQILKNCRVAMPGSAKLLIMDFVLPNHEESISDLLASLHSLVLGGRLLRTEEEFSHLLSEAGFHHPKFIQTGGRISLIEAVPN